MKSCIRPCTISLTRTFAVSNSSSSQRCFIKKLFLKISQKNKSLFNKVADLQGRNFLKKIQQRCFHGNIAKLSRALISKNICEWLYNCSCLFVSPVIFSVTNFPTQLNGFKWSYWYQIENILVSNCYVPKGLKEQMKNGVICLIILYNHRVRVIKMSKMAHFLSFLVVTAKKSKFGQNVQVHLKDPVVYF